MPLTEMLAEHLPQFRLASLLPKTAIPSTRPPQAAETRDEPADADEPAQTMPEPAPQTLIYAPQASMDEVCERLAASAQAYDLPVPFFARLIWQESRFDTRAVSPAGAKGVAQFMPKVAAQLGLYDPFDPIAALPVSARFLQSHYRTFGNLGLAAAAYNAGPRRVMDWLARRGKLPDETRNYVLKITGQAPEKWIEEKPLDLALKLPHKAPCAGVAELSPHTEPTRVFVQLDDSIQRVIETAKAEAAARAAKAKAAKSRATILAKSKRAKDQIAGEKAKTSKGRVRLAETARR